jgi:branched-subunit amino acid ABC-type transport system permease component
MLVSESALFSFQVYGITIVIAMLAAVLIKALVVLTARVERGVAAKSVPQGAVCPVAMGIPDEDVAALTAAIYAAIGPHVVLHISPTSRTWSSHGRAAQHTSHAVFQRPQH